MRPLKSAMIFVIVIGVKSGTRRLARTKPELPFSTLVCILPTLFFFPLFSIIFFFPTGIHFISSFVLHPPCTPAFPPVGSPPSCLRQPTSPTPRAFNNSLTTSCHGCKPAPVCNSTPNSGSQIFEPLERVVVSVRVLKIYSPTTQKRLRSLPKNESPIIIIASH